MRTKAEIREALWDLLRTRKVARFPGAVGRIPNFLGAERCAPVLAQTDFWKRAKVVKVNPDSPQRAIRQAALQNGKILYMAVPRLRSDKPFIELDLRKLNCSAFVASSIKGAAQHGRPVTLNELRKIDLIVCGSVAVNRKGERLGKGGGYSDLEFALLTESKKIGPKTPVVTTVHPLQVVEEEIPMTNHDIPLSAIITPQEVIRIDAGHRRPKGIYWDMLSDEKLAAIPVLGERDPR